jgi:hypothetical protein
MQCGRRDGKQRRGGRTRRILMSSTNCEYAASQPAVKREAKSTTHVDGDSLATELVREGSPVQALSLRWLSSCFSTTRRALIADYRLIVIRR